MATGQDEIFPLHQRQNAFDLAAFCGLSPLSQSHETLCHIWSHKKHFFPEPAGLTISTTSTNTLRWVGATNQLRNFLITLTLQFSIFQPILYFVDIIKSSIIGYTECDLVLWGFIFATLAKL